MKNIRTYLQFGALGGTIYLLGRFVIFQVEGDFTSMGDWLFRIVVIGFVSLSIINYKRKNNNYLTIKDGATTGIIVSLFLAVFMAISAWFYSDVLNPNYNENLEKNYREFHYNKMMRKYVFEKWNRDTITPGAIDTVQRGLELNIKNSTGYYFTTSAHVWIHFLYTLFWGLATAITVAMLIRNVKEE